MLKKFNLKEVTTIDMTDVIRANEMLREAVVSQDLTFIGMENATDLAGFMIYASNAGTINGLKLDSMVNGEYAFASI